MLIVQTSARILHPLLLTAVMMLGFDSEATIIYKESQIKVLTSQCLLLPPSMVQYPLYVFPNFTLHII